MLYKISSFEGLFKILKELGNEALVLALCDGTPLLLDKLNYILSECKTQEGMSNGVNHFVMKKLKIARFDDPRKELPDLKKVLRLVQKIQDDDDIML